jgi:hypothetical protein
MKITPWLLSLSLLAACSGNSSTGGGNGTTSSSSSSSGGSGNGWTIVPLDTTDGGDDSDLELAVGPGDVVGVAYYKAYVGDAGTDFNPYQVRYVQYANGKVSAPSVIDTISHPAYGLSLAIQSSGLPVVAYLGGASYGMGAAASIYWVNSQALVAYQQAGGTWTQQVANDAQHDMPAQMVNACPTLSMTDYGAAGVGVLGLFPAIGFDSKGTAYDYFRNVHFGQSIGTTSDFASSDINGEIGGPATWTDEWAYAGNIWNYDGAVQLGLGGHIRMAMVHDQPALVTDEFSSSAGDNNSGENVDFMMRLASTPTSDWSCPQRIISAGATWTGPSMAWDATFGYAVTVYDAVATKLLYTSSTDGVTWPGTNNVDDVYAGAGGWYPSIAISPVTHKPTIADFLCSNVPGPTAIQQCAPAQQAIETRTFTGGSFAAGVVVDPAGGFEPKIGFLSTGKMVIAYRQLPTYNLVLAVQQ